MKKAKQNTKSFLKLFAKYKVNQLVKPKTAQDPFQVKLRLMDIDTGVILYMCVNKSDYRDTFTEQELDPYTQPLQPVAPETEVEDAE